MAIDTRERRQAVASLTYLGPNVTPNATPDQEWRQEVGWGYPGILAGVDTFTPGSDMNTTLREYLNDLYTITNTDLVPLLDRYLDADTLSDKTVSFRELRIVTDKENR